MNRIFTIADIHGELDKLNTLLTNLELQPTDSFIFIGDYVDRGPNSYGVIERLLELEKTNKCVFLAGNHDVCFWDDTMFREGYSVEPKKLSQLLNNERRYTLWNQGAKETYQSYINAGKLPDVHLPFYKKLEPYYILESDGKKHLFIHGGYNRHELLETQKNNTVFFWDRDLLLSAYSNHTMQTHTYKLKNKDNFRFIYVGHTPVNYWGFTEPQLWSNVWAMDTGVGKYKDAELYALEINSHKLYK